MKKIVIALALSAFTAGVLSPVLVSTQAQAWHETKCKKGYYYDEDDGRCKRKTRGSH